MPPPADPAPTSGLSYRDAGVDIDAGDALVERIKPFAKRTMRPEVLAGIGGFGALVEIGKRFRDPVLVAGTDGVGTKLKLAFALGRHDTIGIDLVAMSVNDILVQGAEPLFFLDYFACGKLDVDVAARVVKGIAHGCEQAGCALIGGETAEMPGMYAEGEYDLAGFAVGVVEKAASSTGARSSPGDVVLGLASSRAALQRLLADPPHRRPRAAPTSAQPLGARHARRRAAGADAHLREAGARADARGAGEGHGAHHRRRAPRERAAHAAAGLQARLDASRWPRPPIFDWLQRTAASTDDEMHRVFNCGIGLVIVVAPEHAERAL